MDVKCCLLQALYRQYNCCNRFRSCVCTMALHVPPVNTLPPPHFSAALAAGVLRLLVCLELSLLGKNQVK
jgi:hypothetical protein